MTLRLADQADVAIDNFRPGVIGGDEPRLRNARRAQPAHPRMLDFRLRRRRSNERRVCNLQSVGQDLTARGIVSRAPGAPSHWPRPARSDLAAGGYRQRAYLVGGNLLRYRPSARPGWQPSSARGPPCVPLSCGFRAAFQYRLRKGDYVARAGRSFRAVRPSKRTRASPRWAIG